jgi:hypothetical protein
MGSLLIGNFIEDTKVSLEILVVDADNQTKTGTGFSMAGYQGVLFIAVAKGGENMTYGLKAQQAAATNFAGAADLENTNVVFTTTTVLDGLGLLEIHNPAKEYVRPMLVVPNVTTPTSVAVIAIRYGKNWRPETNANSEFHEAPAEGTA